MEKTVKVANGSAVKRTNKLVYLAIMLFSFILMASVYVIKPPFGSPDEATHLFRANSMTHGYIMLKPVGKNGVTGGEVDQNLGKAVINFNNYVYSYSWNGREQVVDKLRGLDWDNKISDIGLPTTAFYLPVVYLPQAVSFYIGQKLHLNLYSTYRLLNVVTFAVCMLLLILAYRIYPLPPFSLAIILLPMSLYQLFSPTIDGISLGITAVAMSLFMKLLKKEIATSEAASLIALSLCIIIAAGSRANLVFMIFMPLWLFIVHHKKRYLSAFLVVATLTLGWIAFSIISSHDPSSLRNTSLSNSQIIAFYIKHPLVLIGVFFNTLADPEKIQFYQQSLIGNFGWLDAPVTQKICNFFTGLILFTFLASLIMGKGKNDKPSSLFISALALISFLLVFSALLVQWSTFPASTIEGVQGRYFIIPLVMLGYALPELKISKKVLSCILIFTGLFSTFIVRETLIDRYQNKINIPQESEISKESTIYNLDGNQSLSLKLKSHTGVLKSVSVLMANYKNTAKGTVKMNVCSGDNCTESQLNISNLHDNSYYEFILNNPLKIKGNDLSFDIRFNKDANSNPVALWMFKSKDGASAPLPKMQLKFTEIN